jgi:hypothetical protein
VLEYCAKSELHPRSGLGLLARQLTFNDCIVRYAETCRAGGRACATLDVLAKPLHRHHNLADLFVRLHVSMGLDNLIKLEGLHDDGFKDTGG